MKALYGVIFLLFLGAMPLQAQRFAYVDVDFILDNLEEYEQAQTQIDNVAEQWRQEIETMMNEVDEMYRTFQAEQVLLTEPMKQQRIAEIEAKEKEITDYQRAKFGPRGELFDKRQQFIQPIQDKIYEAVKELAREKGYDFIFDKSSGLVMLHAANRYDRSQEVLNKLKNK